MYKTVRRFAAAVFTASMLLAGCGAQKTKVKADYIEVTADDLTAPIIRVYSYQIKKGDKFDKTKVYSVTDNMTKTPKVTLTGDTINTNKVGDYHLTIKATDDAGNSSEAKASVYVVEDGVTKAVGDVQIVQAPDRDVEVKNGAVVKSADKSGSSDKKSTSSDKASADSSENSDKPSDKADASDQKNSNSQNSNASQPQNNGNSGNSGSNSSRVKPDNGGGSNLNAEKKNSSSNKNSSNNGNSGTAQKPTPKPTAKPKPSAKPTSTPKPTAKPKPTSTPKPTEKPVPTVKPTVEPTPTAKPTPSAAPSDIPEGKVRITLSLYTDAPLYVEIRDADGNVLDAVDFTAATDAAHAHTTSLVVDSGTTSKADTRFSVFYYVKKTDENAQTEITPNADISYDNIGDGYAYRLNKASWCENAAGDTANALEFYYLSCDTHFTISFTRN